MAWHWTGNKPLAEQMTLFIDAYSYTFLTEFQTLLCMKWQQFCPGGDELTYFNAWADDSFPWANFSRHISNIVGEI